MAQTWILSHDAPCSSGQTPVFRSLRNVMETFTVMKMNNGSFLTVLSRRSRYLGSSELSAVYMTTWDMTRNASHRYALCLVSSPRGTNTIRGKASSAKNQRRTVMYLFLPEKQQNNSDEQYFWPSRCPRMVIKCFETAPSRSSKWLLTTHTDRDCNPPHHPNRQILSQLRYISIRTKCGAIFSDICLSSAFLVLWRLPK